MSVFNRLKVSDDPSGAYDLFVRVDQNPVIFELNLPAIEDFDIGQFVINLSVRQVPPVIFMSILDEQNELAKKKEHRIRMYTSASEIQSWYHMNQASQIFTILELSKQDVTNDEYGVIQKFKKHCEDSGYQWDKVQYSEAVVTALAEFYACLQVINGGALRVGKSLKKYMKVKELTEADIIKNCKASEELIHGLIVNDVESRSKQTPIDIYNIRKFMEGFPIDTRTLKELRFKEH